MDGVFVISQRQLIPLVSDWSSVSGRYRGRPIQWHIHARYHVDQVWIIAHVLLCAQFLWAIYIVC